MQITKKIIEKLNNSRLQTSQIIAIGFLTVILVGTFVLMLPISSNEGCITPFVDALFTATTSVCVTGLTVVSTAHYWSPFGQLVILILVQLGGLGIITTVMAILIATHNKIGLKNRLLIQESYGFDSLHGMAYMVNRIVKGTFLVEAVGAICFMPVLISKFGLKGIWHSIFLSISTFCNAGMDTMGDDSLASFVGNYWMNAVVMTMIVISGLGFIVWWEVLRLWKEKRQKKLEWSQVWNKTSLHTKIVLVTTAFLLLSGMLVVLLYEYSNPETLGNLNFPEKVMAAMFQSVTTRTAGFYTVPQTGLTDGSSLVCMVLMFIGGSPAGTAGGVKTVTVAMIFLAAFATFKGDEELKVFRRQISNSNIRKGLAIILLSLSIWFVMTTILCALESANFMTICYETMSAIGTVGLSKDFTPTLHTAGRCVIIVMMYLGRIGPITLATAFLDHGHKEDMFRYPEENVMIG